MSEFSDFTRALVARIADLETKIVRLETAIANMIREGRVTKVSADGTAEVDMNGLPSAALPVMMRAGKVSEWNMPSEGERVTVINPTGDPGLGLVLLGGPSDGFPAVHDKPEEHRRKTGDVTTTQGPDGFVIKAGGTEYRFTAEGFIQTGGRQEHDGKNTGKDHVHDKVVPGGALTGFPQP